MGKYLRMQMYQWYFFDRGRDEKSVYVASDNYESARKVVNYLCNLGHEKDCVCWGQWEILNLCSVDIGDIGMN